MNQDKINLLKNYISANVAPILIDFVSDIHLSNSISIPANCDESDFNGHFLGKEFLPPKWYYELIHKKDTKVIVINNIDSISKEEQLKFKELLKYKQVATFKIPEKTRIILTAKKVNKNTINEEIYSLVAHI